MWDIKQHEDWQDSKQQGTGGNHSRIRQTGHQAVEDNMDNKEQRAFRTSGGREQPGHQAEKVFQDQDIRGRRINGTSNSR